MKKLCLAALPLVCVMMPAFADTNAPVARAPVEEKPALFAAQDGKSIYEGICQGCHMPGGKGARGAGAYPALANNPNLEEPGYPVSIILNGQKAMPQMGSYLNDAQVANVTNYIRSSFGNRFKNRLTAAEVKVMR